MPKTLIISLILVFILPGCASFHPLKDETDDSYSQTAHNWYPLPNIGSQITLYSKNTNKEITVTVIDSYHAASGRSCSLYSINGKIDTGNPSGLACRANNSWTNVPFIVNPDANPAGS